MDKYEYNVKLEQIKKLIRKKDYATAAQIADTIDWFKVKNNQTIVLIADVYEASGRYDQARENLKIAYDRSGLGRQIAYKLVKVCIKCGDIEEAEDYYDDFVSAAPRDISKYLLQYELAKAKGEALDKQISILEQYLEEDMDDRWAFELAKLYHKTGQRDKCIEQCDTVMLWFGDGKYVDKAMDLKMIYTPLTKSQQQRYEARWREKSAQNNIKIEEIKVKEVDVANKYNTQNIQNALKESMDELFAKEGKQEDIFKPKSTAVTEKATLKEAKSPWQPESLYEEAEESVENADDYISRMAQNSMTYDSEQALSPEEIARKQLNESGEEKQQIVQKKPHEMETAHEDDFEDEFPESESDIGDTKVFITTRSKKNLGDTKVFNPKLVIMPEQISFEKEEPEEINEMPQEAYILEERTIKREETLPETEVTEEIEKVAEVEEEEAQPEEIEEVEEEAQPEEIEEVEEEAQPEEIEEVEEEVAQPEEIEEVEEEVQPEEIEEVEEEALTEEIEEVEEEVRPEEIEEVEEEVQPEEIEEVEEEALTEEIEEVEEEEALTEEIEEVEEDEPEVEIEILEESDDPEDLDEEEIIEEPEKGDVIEDPEEDEIEEEIFEEAIMDEIEAEDDFDLDNREVEEQIEGQMSIEDFFNENGDYQIPEVEEEPKTEPEEEPEAMTEYEMVAQMVQIVEPSAWLVQAEEPVIEEPVMEEPVMEEPVMEEPVVEEENFDPFETIAELKIDKSLIRHNVGKQTKEYEDEDEETYEEYEDEYEDEDDSEGEPEEEKLSNEEIKEIIKDFIGKYSGVQGLDKQMLKTLQHVIVENNCNILIMGDAKSGKTSLGIDIIKVVNKIKRNNNRRIAKISADKLLGKDMSVYFEKLKGSDLFIENIGLMDNNTWESLIEAMNYDADHRIVVIEDEKANAEKFMEKHREVETYFVNRINVKQNKIKDWVSVAQEYAESRGYDIDEIGLLALHARIDQLYGVTLVIQKNHVESIIDSAIRKAEKGGFLKKIFSKKKDKILTEEFFN